MSLVTPSWRKADLSRLNGWAAAALLAPRRPFCVPVRTESKKLVGRDSVRVDSVRETVTAREEVRPVNATTMWVLPLVSTVGRLT